MSAPLKLTSRELSDLSEALDKLSEITRLHDVNFTPHQPLTVSIGVSTITISFDTESRTYIVDDTVGV